MLRTLLRTSFRSLRRRLGYTVINVLGLAIGLACCLMIGLYVQYHLFFDQHHEKADRIVRVASVFNERVPVALTPNILAPTMKDVFPEVEATVRVASTQGRILRKGGQATPIDDFYFADPSVFDVFTIPVLQGDADGALDDPWTLVLTESAAETHFASTTEAIGKTLSINRQQYTVTGIVEDPPSTSHWQYGMLASSTPLSWYAQENYRWSMANYVTYAVLNEPDALAPLQAKIDAMVEERIGEQMEASGFSLSYVLQPLTRIHLHVEGNITYVYLFGGIALLILVVAGVNFVNLATARSTERAQEVGVRKTLGAGRTELVAQFMMEAVVLAVLAGVVALAMGQGMLHYFEQLAQANLSGTIVFDPVVVSLLLLGALVTGLVAGAYPALVLSGFKPVRVLGGSFDARPEGQWLRHVLVVTQFAASIALIAGTFVVYNQLTYVQSKNLGFDREHVVTLPLMRPLKSSIRPFHRELQSVAGVNQVSAVSSLPGEQHGGYSFSQVGREGEGRSFPGLVSGLISEPGIVDALGLNLIAGERLPESPNYSIEAQGTPFLINETIAKGIGWSAQEAIGQPLTLNERAGYVRGVVADFHVASLRSAIDPVVLFMEQDGLYALDHAVIRLDGDQIPSVLREIERVWGQFAEGIPFSYSFLDDQYEALYRAEQRTGRVLGVISVLAVFVACLGLLGLAAYTTQRRMKEISVRKVLGATVPQILMLLSRNVLILVGVSFVIAVPLAYVASKTWLEQFAYATSVGVTPFLVAGGVTALMATAATMIQSMKAANANPARVLQRE